MYLNLSFSEFVQKAFATILLTLITAALLYWLREKAIHRRISPNENKLQPEYDVFNFCSNPNCLRCSRKISKRELLNVFGKRVAGDAKLKKFQTWFEQNKNSSKDGKQQPTVFFLPDLKTSPTVNSIVYKNDVLMLESNFDVILTEFNRISKDRSGWKINSTPSGTWNVFYLYNQGQKICMNASRCPRTVESIENLENFLKDCAFGNACFSVLEPGSSISEHYGPCNVRIRCHLGLCIPDKWNLCVDDTTLAWKESKCILFDDSYLHSVSQRRKDGGHLSRAVFMVDLWHYNLTAEEKDIIRNMFSPI